MWDIAIFLSLKEKKRVLYICISHFMKHIPIWINFKDKSLGYKAFGRNKEKKEYDFSRWTDIVFQIHIHSRCASSPPAILLLSSFLKFKWFECDVTDCYNHSWRGGLLAPWIYYQDFQWPPWVIQDTTGDTRLREVCPEWNRWVGYFRVLLQALLPGHHSVCEGRGGGY